MIYVVNWLLQGVVLSVRMMLYVIGQSMQGGGVLVTKCTGWKQVHFCKSRGHFRVLKEYEKALKEESNE